MPITLSSAYSLSGMARNEPIKLALAGNLNVSTLKIRCRNVNDSDNASCSGFLLIRLGLGKAN